MLVADLTHYLDLSDDAPGPARRLAEQLGRIVQAATAGPAGERWASTVTCTRRPGNKPCPGTLAVARGSGEDDRIHWQCAACGDAGTISGWAGSPYDLRRHTPTPVDATTRPVTVPISTVAVLREVLMLDPAIERAVHAARAHGPGRAVLQLGDDELDELLDAVAAEANHAPDRRTQKQFDTAFHDLDTAATARGRT